MNVRDDFPILSQTARGKPLVYLDSAATTQKPRAVIDAVRAYYERDNANVHRAVYELSERATRRYEEARGKVRRFLNARADDEIVFTRGATEGINLVAQTFGRMRARAGGEVLITAMEHHSNIVPWQMLCERTGMKLKVVPIDDAGALVAGEFERALGPQTCLAAVTHVSNALGTVNPVQALVRAAHAKGVPVLVDGAQAAPHAAVDVQAIDCDFYAFSGHKLYGPTGIGALYAKAEHLRAMPPYQGGGDMILSVTFEKTEYNVPPYKFEAGTPNMAGAVGLGAAIDYVTGLSMDAIARHERALLTYATAALERVPGLRVIGRAPEKAAVISFVVEGIHPHDLGTIVDREGVAIRTGHHCAQPVMKRYGVPATARASFGVYNTERDVDALVAALGKAIEMFR